MDAVSRCDVLEWAMAESVPVRCPACRREHLFAAPAYPCVCGAPVAAPLDRLAEPVPVTHRVWDEDWVTVPCGTCGREDEWPRPELDCPCGTVLRIPVQGVRQPLRAELAPGATAPADPGPDAAPADPSHTADASAPGRADTSAPPDTDATAPGPGGASPAEGGGPSSGVPGAGDGSTEDEGVHGETPPSVTARSDEPRPDEPPRGEPGPDGSPSGGPAPAPVPTPRPAFQPVTIRTARDAVTAAALYLRWLGYRDIRRADQRPPSGIGLAARGVLAQVDPTVLPASLRDVECLWLTAMSESTRCVYFSLAGYADDARARADTLGVPLFVLDLTGTPQPVNSPADDLVATGA